MDEVKTWYMEYFLNTVSTQCGMTLHKEFIDKAIEKYSKLYKDSTYLEDSKFSAYVQRQVSLQIHDLSVSIAQITSSLSHSTPLLKKILAVYEGHFGIDFIDEMYDRFLDKSLVVQGIVLKETMDFALKTIMEYKDARSMDKSKGSEAEGEDLPAGN